MRKTQHRLRRVCELQTKYLGFLRKGCFKVRRRPGYLGRTELCLPLAWQKIMKNYHHNFQGPKMMSPGCLFYPTNSSKPNQGQFKIIFNICCFQTSTIILQQTLARGLQMSESVGPDIKQTSRCHNVQLRTFKNIVHYNLVHHQILQFSS